MYQFYQLEVVEAVQPVCILELDGYIEGGWS